MAGIQINRSFVIIKIVLAGLVLGLTCASYWAGLHGSFLFDDFANLPALGESGPVDNWQALLRYVTSGHADPIGRPLSMLSFLLDAHDWPADPFPFKRTNLLLHVFNGLALMLLLRRLGYAALQRTEEKKNGTSSAVWRIDLAAIFGAAFWLLHPLFISTTLYIVQREAILPATFTLIGFLLWLRGREAIFQGQTTRGLAWIAIGLGGCTLLAMLCKANGILLPALALVVEYTLLHRTPSPQLSPAYRKAMYLLAWLPTVVIASYLAWQGWHGLVYGVSSLRPWTLGQRLLTEPRVLMDYLALLWMPRPFTAGLFNDQFSASTSLWSPVTTLPSILAVLGLLFVGWRIRKRSPPLAAAILFYFVGQSLESSTVALELYFEHRNYLPTMLMFWPAALWLCDIFPTLKIKQATGYAISLRSLKRQSVGKLALALSITLGLALMTHVGAQLWGDVNDQAFVWAKLNPDSPRAQINAAETEMIDGHAAFAVERLEPLLAKHPDQVQLALNLLGAECLMGYVQPETIEASRTSLRTARDPGSLLVSWFSRVIDQTTTPPCPQLTPDLVETLLDAALDNAYFKDIPGRLQDIHYLKGLLALKQREPDAALLNFNRALDLQVRPAIALQQTALLGSAGYPQLGLTHLTYYESLRYKETPPITGMPGIHSWVLQKQHYWQHETTRLRAALQQDMHTPGQT